MPLECPPGDGVDLCCLNLVMLPWISMITVVTVVTVVNVVTMVTMASRGVAVVLVGVVHTQTSHCPVAVSLVQVL